MHATGIRRLQRIILGTLVIGLTLLALLAMQKWLGVQAVVKPVSAYQAAVTITPASRSLNVQPGTTEFLTHTLKNTGDETGVFTITAQTTQSIFSVSFPGLTNPHTNSLDPDEEVTITIQVTTSGAATNGAAGAVNLAAVLTTNPSNIAVGVNTLTVIVPTPTATPTTTPTPDANVYTDRFEPNNSIADATDLIPGSGQKCTLTLWPVGDKDFYRFFGKAGATYQITTQIQSPGLDTFMTIYNTDFNVIGQNDDYQETGGASQFTLTAGSDGYYFAEITNVSPSDPANKTYCIESKEVVPTATPTPELLQTDAYENNGNFDIAALIETGKAVSADFVPPIPPGPDNDYYALWIKPNIYYTCETDVAGSPADTNMILYDANYIGLAGNDDKATGDLGSKVSYYSTYTGWLYILVGAYNPPPYDESPLYTYTMLCVSEVSTPTPTPSATPTPRPPTTGGGGGVVATATPTLIPSPTPTIGSPTTPIVAQPTPTQRPNIVFQPLPTPTPSSGSGGQIVMLNVTVYYDANENFLPEQSEGIMNVQVSLYDSATGAWLAFGYTNAAGMVPFGPLEVNGPVLVSAPYLGFNQTVPPETSSLEIRVAPHSLPGGIP
jgi:hypothetical protein